MNLNSNHINMIKNYAYNIGYQLLILLLPIVTVPYIARILGPTGVGINSYTASVMQYFILFANLGVNIYGNREIAYVQDDRNRRSIIFWEIFILRIILTMISYVIFLLFLVYEKKYTVYYFEQSFALLAVMFDISWLFIGLEDLKKTVIRNTIVKVLSLVLIFLMVKNSSDIGVYILILSLSTLIGNLTFFQNLNKYIEKIPLKKLRPLRHLKSSLILFIPQMSVTVYLVLNKTILGFIKGPTDVGYYENANKIISIILSIITATKNVIMPRVANLYANGKTKTVKKYTIAFFNFLNMLAIPVAFGVIVYGINFAEYFFGKEFTKSGIILLILAPTIIFISWSTVIGQQYLLPLNKMKEYNSSVLITAVLNILLNLIMVRKLGLYGVAFATVLSEFFVAAFQLYLIKNEIVLRNLFAELWKYLVSGLIMFFSLIMLSSVIGKSILSMVVGVLVGVLIYFAMLLLLRAKMLNFIRK